MRTDSDRNLSAEADPNPARKTRERVLTLPKTRQVSVTFSHDFIDDDSTLWTLGIYEEDSMGELNRVMKTQEYIGRTFNSETSEPVELSAGTYYMCVEVGEDNWSGYPYYVCINTDKRSQSLKVPASLDVDVKKGTTLKVTGAKGALSFSSSVPAIATVNKKGYVVGKKVGKAIITIVSGETNDYKAAKKRVTINVLPGASSKVTIVNNAKGLKVSWKKIAGADRYYVTRNNEELGETKEVSFIDTMATVNGKKYTYTIQGVTSSGKKSSTITKAFAYRLISPKSFLAQAKKGNKAALKWGKNAKGTGYEIQYSLSNKYQSGVKSVDVKKASITSKTIAKLKNKKIYYFRIRAYKKVGKNTYYSTWKKAAEVRAY